MNFLKLIQPQNLSLCTFCKTLQIKNIPFTFKNTLKVQFINKKIITHINLAPKHKYSNAKLLFLKCILLGIEKNNTNIKPLFKILKYSIFTQNKLYFPIF